MICYDDCVCIDLISHKVNRGDWVEVNMFEAPVFEISMCVCVF